jgi:hypothetical protein
MSGNSSWMPYAPQGVKGFHDDDDDDDSQFIKHNTLRTGDADLRFYITNLQDG